MYTTAPLRAVCCVVWYCFYFSTFSWSHSVFPSWRTALFNFFVVLIFKNIIYIIFMCCAVCTNTKFIIFLCYNSAWCGVAVASLSELPPKIIIKKLSSDFQEFQHWWKKSVNAWLNLSSSDLRMWKELSRKEKH